MSYTVGYVRVSTTRQLDGAGPAQQRDSIIAYAVSMQIRIDEFATDDETGTTEDREEIQRLLGLARAGKLTCLIVDRMDRLGRHMHVCEKLYADFTSAGCKVVLCNIPQADDSAEGVMMRQMMGVIAQYQRSALLKHMKSCKVAKARRRGYYVGGSVPYGYRLDQGADVIVPDEIEAHMVRRVFALRAQGKSYNRISEILYAEGYRPRNAERFAKPVLWRITLNEEAYRGKRSFADKSAPANHAPILT